MYYLKRVGLEPEFFITNPRFGLGFGPKLKFNLISKIEAENFRRFEAA